MYIAPRDFDYTEIAHFTNKIERNMPEKTNQTEEENTEKDNADDGKEIEGKTSDDDFMDPAEGIKDGDL